jgi:hypothetical protein
MLGIVFAFASVSRLCCVVVGVDVVAISPLFVPYWTFQGSPMYWVLCALHYWLAGICEKYIQVEPPPPPGVVAQKT